MAQVDRSRWVCLYPIYINSKKTVAQGRKIPQSKAVEDPELHLICESIAYLKLPLYPEVLVLPFCRMIDCLAIAEINICGIANCTETVEFECHDT